MISYQTISSLIHEGDLTVQDADIIVRLYAEAMAAQAQSPYDYMLNRFGICLKSAYINRGLHLSEQEYTQKMTIVSAKFREIVHLYLQGFDADSIVVQLTDKVPTRPSTPVGENTSTPPLAQYARYQQGTVQYPTADFIPNDQRSANGNKRTRLLS